MYMDVDGSFDEVIRLNLSASIPCPHSDRGCPGKKHKIETLTSGEPLKTLQRRRERKGYRSVTGLCKQKQILPPKTGVRPLFPLNNSGMKILLLQEKENEVSVNVQRKLQFLWSVTGFLQTTLSVTASQHVACSRPPRIALQAFVQTAVTNVTLFALLAFPNSSFSIPRSCLSFRL